jgi:glutamate-1-semialdehyde 2,1-aminomutase
LLIFDEVKTGFRASLGGYQGLADVCPDLSTFGKAFANGFPIAALAGKQHYMDLAISDDPARRVLVAGTYNCHPVPVAAAVACLRKLMDPVLDVYGKLERLALRLEAGQCALLDRFGIAAVICRLGSAHCIYFTKSDAGTSLAPTCWWDVLELHDFEFDTSYRRALIERGVYHFPVACKQGSISYAHSQQDIDDTLAITEDVLRKLIH